MFFKTSLDFMFIPSLQFVHIFWRIYVDFIPREQAVWVVAWWFSLISQCELCSMPTPPACRVFYWLCDCQVAVSNVAVSTVFLFSDIPGKPLAKPLFFRPNLTADHPARQELFKTPSAFDVIPA
jgi:hypothetical protein